MGSKSAESAFDPCGHQRSDPITSPDGTDPTKSSRRGIPACCHHCRYLGNCRNNERPIRLGCHSSRHHPRSLMRDAWGANVRFPPIRNMGVAPAFDPLRKVQSPRPVDRGARPHCPRRGLVLGTAVHRHVCLCLVELTTVSRLRVRLDRQVLKSKE